MSDYLAYIQCLDCHSHFPDKNIMLEKCPTCGSAWLDAQYDYASVQQKWQNGLGHGLSSLWRYGDLLPNRPTLPQIPMGEGYTPLYRLIQYERHFQHQGQLYIKDERVQPTNSFKDRQAAVSVMAMAQAGVKECVLASTGNAAVAYAAYCARAGIKLWLFLTSLVPPEKMREAALYGCEVIKVSGTYDETKHVAAEFAARKGIRFDKGAKSIPGKESMKTLGFEIAEQLGLVNADKSGKVWQSPDWYIQAVSGGIGPIGVWKGFSELFQMGLIDKMPRLALVQAAGCAPMVSAFHAGLEDAPAVVPQTLIHVLATGEPGKAYNILREACLSNGGTMLAIEDGEAFAAMRQAAHMGGISAEPATAVAFAGLAKLLESGAIAPHETVVLNCSGHTFSVESHILNNQYERSILNLDLGKESEHLTDGLGAAIQTLDEQVTTIVLVDDNPLDRRLMRRFLQTYKDYRIYEARDGQEALKVIQERKPDLVVTDLMMPEIDGFSLIEHLRNNPETAKIPVVVVSAKTLTAHEQARLNDSVQAIWQKAGIEPRVLVQDIVRTLGHEPLGIIEQSTTSEMAALKKASRIVIIDDNPLDLRLARRIIQSGKQQYDLHESQTGRDGLKAIYSEKPDLIILDMNLPDMTGVQIIETLQKDASLRDIPVIIYSAQDLNLEERQQAQSSIRNIIHKSDVNRHQFLTMIEDELD